ncbi:MAG: adenylate kinase [Patescibacteria group bacterium]|jgi:adenylate kinase
MAKNFYIMFGPPGSGKGTQAEILGKRLNLPTISTGVLLRKEIENKTELGKEVESIMAAGNLVSDEIVAKMIDNRLKEKDAGQGAILDGYPRTLNQQDFLLSIFKKTAEAVVTPLLVDVSDDEVIKRLGGRRACACGATYHMIYKPPKNDEICDVCGTKLVVRPDDQPEVIKERLKVYHKNVDPVIDYWKKSGKLIIINGEPPIKEVAEEIEKRLKETSIG